jgi:hypothetical protein
MSDSSVQVRRGRHFGWWVDGHFASGRRFMLTWWPAEGMARTVARLVGRRAKPGVTQTQRDPGSAEP